MTSHPQIPSLQELDLSAQNASIGGEIRTAVERVMASQQFVLGREGVALEEEIARLRGVAHGVGVASGTDALILALRAVFTRETKCSCRRLHLRPREAPSALSARSPFSRTSGRIPTTSIPPNSNTA